MKAFPTRAWFARLGAASATMIATGIVASPSHAQCQYEVIIIQSDLDCGPLGPPITISTGLNELGHVVGYHYCLLPENAVPFLWTAESGLTTLDMPSGTASAQARDISADGTQVVGFFDISGDGLNNIAFLIDGDELIQIPPPAGAFSNAEAVSLGRVVGTTSDSDGPPFNHKAYLWQEGRMTIIEPTFGPRCAGRDISDASSQIVGWMGTGIGIDSHAFLWQDGQVTDLGLPPNTISASANAINNFGQIAIGAKFEPDHPRGLISGGFLCDAGQWTDLGMLPGYDSMAVNGLNDSTQVVGWVRAINSGGGPDHAFIWQRAAMTDLNDLIPADLGLVIKRAEAINNAGQIITRATSANGTVAVLLTPVDPPLGDLDGDCHVGILDLLILLADWGRARSPADLDGDGVVGIFDLLTLLANWT